MLLSILYIAIANGGKLHVAYLLKNLYLITTILTILTCKYGGSIHERKHQQCKTYIIILHNKHIQHTSLQRNNKK